MIKRYYSSYTGKQIDEAVKAIVENQINLEDFSPELIEELKEWITSMIATSTNKLVLTVDENDPECLVLKESETSL